MPEFTAELLSKATDQFLERYPVEPMDGIGLAAFHRPVRDVATGRSEPYAPSAQRLSTRQPALCACQRGRSGDRGGLAGGHGRFAAARRCLPAAPRVFRHKTVAPVNAGSSTPITVGWCNSA